MSSIGCDDCVPHINTAAAAAVATVAAAADADGTVARNTYIESDAPLNLAMFLKI
jgi:hypothetical protein